MLLTPQQKTNAQISASGPEAYEIVFQLRKHGVTQSDIAKELNVTYSSVSNVIHGRATSFRIAVRLAAQIGRTVQELWPGRYEFKPRKS